MKPKRSWRSASKTTYNKFCETHKDVKISFKDYQNVIKEYNKSILMHILDTGELINLPWGIGPLSINKYKKKITKKTTDNGNNEMYTYSINWPETRKAGKYIYHLNLHTQGFSYTWFWSPKLSNVKFPHIWRLEIWREIKRLLPKKLKDPSFSSNDIYRTRNKRRHFK